MENLFMKRIVVLTLAGAALLIGMAGCEVEPVGGAYVGVSGEYPSAYSGHWESPGYVYPYSYGPYYGRHYWYHHPGWHRRGEWEGHRH